MKHIIKKLAIIIAAIVAIIIIFEIGWINGANYMQIKANYGDASNAFVHLIYLEDKDSGTLKIAESGLRNLEIAEELESHQMIVGLYFKGRMDKISENNNVMNTVRNYLKEIVRKENKANQEKAIEYLKTKYTVNGKIDMNGRIAISGEGQLLNMIEEISRDINDKYKIDCYISAIE